MADNDGHFSAYTTAKGALYITFKNLATAIAGSLFFMFLARVLPSVSDLGLIHGLQILILIGVSLAGLGLANAATRFISYHIGAGRINLANETSRLIFVVGLISSFLIALILSVIADDVALILFHDVTYTNLIRITSVDVFIFSMVTFSSFILYSLQEFKKVAVIMTANSVLKFSASSALLLLGLGIEGVIVGIICGDIVTLLVYIWFLRPQIIGRINRIHIRMLKDLLSYSLPIFGGQILHFLSINIDYYLVLSLSGLFIAGVYSPAVLIGTMFLMLIVGIGETLLPYFSRIYGKSGIGSLGEVSVFTSRYVFLIFFPLGFALLSCSSPLIILIFGDKYLQSIYPASIIILSTTVTSLGIVFNHILMSAGYSRLFLVATLIALIVQIILSVATIPSIGANGAALARGVAYVIMFAYPAYRLNQIAGLHYDTYALRNGLFGSVIMATIIFMLNYYLIYAYYLPVGLSVGLFSYFVFLRFTKAMRVQDFEIINNILSNKMRYITGLVAKIVIKG